jgi:hypothetical protein
MRLAAAWPQAIDALERHGYIQVGGGMR